MDVTVDYGLCVSSGSCTRVCPEVFELRGPGDLVVLQASPPEGLRQDVEAAAELCPTGAITVTG